MLNFFNSVCTVNRPVVTCGRRTGSSGPDESTWRAVCVPTLAKFVHCVGVGSGHRPGWLLSRDHRPDGAPQRTPSRCRDAMLYILAGVSADGCLDTTVQVLVECPVTVTESGAPPAHQLLRSFGHRRSGGIASPGALGRSEPVNNRQCHTNKIVPLRLWVGTLKHRSPVGALQEPASLNYV